MTENPPNPQATSHASQKEQLLLVGLPNAGKSTLFNLLTGGARKVSNYSGITVDSAVGDLLTNSSQETPMELVDLPGIYNLHPESQDEAVTVGTLLRLYPQHPFTMALVVLDFHRLEASLALALAIKDQIGDKLICLINKDDNKLVSPQEREKLESELGVKVLPVSALETNSEIIDHFIRQNSHKGRNFEKLKGKKPVPLSPYAAALLPAVLQNEKPYKVISLDSDGMALEVSQTINNYLETARGILRKLEVSDEGLSHVSEKIDRVVLHPLWGGLIFLALFYLIFNAIYSWAGPIMNFSEALVVNFGDFLGGYLPEGHFKSLVIDGIIAGVGGVVVFLPQIMLLFFLLSLLEQSGYISRAAIITDKVMSLFGLGGKAFLPYMSGFACAIPGIMAARTIPNQRERLATIMTLPLITCSARLPVYILIVGTFVPSYTVAKIFNTQALAFFFLYFLGSVMALIIAKVLRLSFFKGETGGFIIDLPHYQRPSFKVACRQAWFKGKTFMIKAGTIILGLSILIWFLSTFPQPNSQELVGMTEQQKAAYALEYSALGRMGKAIEPIIEPIGMNWKIGVGLLVSFGARELFVSALGTIYALGEVDEESESLRESLMSATTATGEPVFDLATAWAILIFFVFSLQCTSTLAILKKETGGWKIPLISFAYMLVLAYSGSFIVYRLLS